jgi:hypothetical protein
MKKLLIGLMVAVGVIGLMAGTGYAATDAALINLLVTPIVTTSLTVSPTYYVFGSVDVQTTTGSISGLTLTNDGDIDFSVEKELMDDGDWIIEVSSTAEDGFDLWALVSDNQPDHAAFVTAVSSFGKDGLNQVTNLHDGDNGNNQLEMSKDQTDLLWFRLDMPYAVSLSAEQTIKVRLTATSN